MCGERFCRDHLATIADCVASGRTPVVVYDIDNTLVDTRLRTRAAAHAFATTLGDDERHAFANTTLGHIGWDGAATAGRMGVRPTTADTFHTFWDTFFWDPENFHLDAVVPNTCQWLRDASDLGARTVYLTGRIEALAPATRRQLRAHDLPDADPAHIHCKPSLAVRTSSFKRAVLQQLASDPTAPLVWFMSDTHSDVRVAQDLALPGIVVDFPVRPPNEPAVHPDTPVLRADVEPAH